MWRRFELFDFKKEVENGTEFEYRVINNIDAFDISGIG